jgi:enoyl-[acyl-carrier-protein] reductase (NADH)
MPLQRKKGLVVGIANEHSIAYGCAEAFHRAGAELAITYLSTKAEPYVRPLAEQLNSPIIVPCDVREPGQLEAVFSHIEKSWGRLDFLLHSIAYAPKEDLHSRITDCSQAGFALANRAWPRWVSHPPPRGAAHPPSAISSASFFQIHMSFLARRKVRSLSWAAS